MTSINFLGHEVGKGHPSFIIGEIGLNHNGDIEIAKKLIAVAKEAGCTAVKFQKRDVANLATKNVLDAKDERFPSFGSTYREIRNHIELNRNQFTELMAYAKSLDIPFFCTPFDITSVEFLESLGMEAYKIASHSVSNVPFLEYVAGLGKPTAMSTGMASLEEIDQAVNIFLSRKTPLALLHCVSAYPTPPEACNLSLINFYEERYQIPVGYSGHEIGWIPTLAAIVKGACMIERHITLDIKMVGFDHKLSLPPDHLKQMIQDIRLVEKTIGTGKKQISETEWITRKKYHVSWVSKIDIPAGKIITEDMLTLKNPGTGIPAYQKHLIVGKKTKTTIPYDTLLDLNMLVGS